LRPENNGVASDMREVLWYTQLHLCNDARGLFGPRIWCCKPYSLCNNANHNHHQILSF